jgi:hypothetical protein
VTANVTSIIRQYFVEPLLLELSRLRIAFRRAAPSHMSDALFENCDVVADVNTPYPVPVLADGAQGRLCVQRIEELLVAARARGSQGDEQNDRLSVIDPFLESVAALFGLGCWNADSDENLLVVHDLTVDEPKRTTGYIDKNVTMSGTTRPRLLGWQIKKIG